jgi:AcrR family transcriptional regulator
MPAPPRRRDRARTEDRLVRAVGRVLARDGVDGLGVNALAREAVVDKVLIYRYFAGLDGLLEAFAERGDVWWRVEELLGDDLPPPEGDSPADWLTLVVRRHVEALQRRPLTVELLAWEGARPNTLTRALDRVREKRALDLMAALARRTTIPPKTDIGAVMVLLAAATSHLVVRARNEPGFLGFDLRSARGGDRLYAAIGAMIRGALNP